MVDGLSVIGTSTVQTAALLVFTGLWSVPVLRRLADDIRVVRGTEPPAAKFAVVAVWALTAVLAVCSLRMVIRIAAELLRTF